MSEQEMRLAFEDWAEEREMPLDSYFFAPGQPYENVLTAVAWDAWCAALKVLEP